MEFLKFFLKGGGCESLSLLRLIEVGWRGQ